MAFDYYHHPLASFCWKVSIALHESGADYVGHVVDLSDATQAAALRALWPIGKFPVLRDREHDRVVPESSIIIEYLDRLGPRPGALIPDDPLAALDARLWDRFFDSYLQLPLQKIVADTFRAEGRHDADGVAEARATLRLAYAVLDARLPGREWVAADSFGIADCAAAPALFYANALVPFEQDHPALAAYFDRLCARPSVVRTIRDAQPWFGSFPMHESLAPRFFDPSATSFARPAR